MMIKADKYYLENLNEIMTNGDLDENPRPKYKDGVPAHTKFISQVCENYDLSLGEYPITTLRNTAIKTGIKEILWIYQNQQNTIESAHNMNINWWDEWMNNQGNIGRAYSYNLESHRPNESKKSVVKIKPKIVNISEGELINPIKKDIGISIDNIIYASNYRGYGDYIIINEYNKYLNNETRKYIDCQFINTGYITSIRKDSLLKGQHPKNNLIRTNLGIGYLDDYNAVNNFSKEEIKTLQKIWGRIIKRCYDPTYNEYYKDIFVHQNWHSFKNFLLEIKYVPQYFLAKESNFIGWELDKDYFGSNCYSKETCVFLEKKENIIYKRNQISPIKITENNKICYELTYTSLSSTLGISKGYVRYCIKRGYYKNIKLESIYDNENLYRYELSKNQLNELLIGLKTNPFGRRHIISLWNWANINKKELVECAYETIWSVRKREGIAYLDMTLVQRSNDYIMSNYINKIQYVALQMMVASHLGYSVGKFCHFVQNLHIYDRHFDAAIELINKTPLDIQPSIRLKENKNFYDFTVDDFEILNTENISKIKSPLEIAI